MGDSNAGLRFRLFLLFPPLAEGSLGVPASDDKGEVRDWGVTGVKGVIGVEKADVGVDLGVVW